MHKQKLNSRSGTRELIQKNSLLHNQKLQKLKQQLSNLNNFVPQPLKQQTKNSLFAESKYLLNNQYLLQRSFQKVSETQTAPNKSNYFEKQKSKEIQKNNAILYKKIEQIVKTKKNSTKASDHINKTGKSFSMLQNYPQNRLESINATSVLCLQMIKNKRARSMIKQQQIRQENSKFLKRLVRQKPTICSKKQLLQSKKVKQLSRRLSKFNGNIIEQENQNYYVENTQKYNKKYSLQTNICLGDQHQTGQNKKKLSQHKQYKTIFLPKVSTPQSSKASQQYRRMNTQPIQKHNQQAQQINNLPTLNSFYKSSFDNGSSISPQVNNMNLQNIQQERNYFPAKHNRENSYNNLSKIVQNAKKSNSFHNQIYMQSKKKSLDKKYSVQFGGLQNQKSTMKNTASNKSIKQKGSKKWLRQGEKSIVLAQIEKKYKYFQLNFTFVRYDSHYEILVNKKKRQSQNDNLRSTKYLKSPQNMNSTQNLKSPKQQQAVQNLGPHYSLLKMHSPQTQKHRSSKQILNHSQKLYKQSSNKNKQQKSKKKFKFKSSNVFLSQKLGSNLFSTFDYDYYRIIDSCLDFFYDQDERIQIKLRQQYFEYENAIIKPNLLLQNVKVKQKTDNILIQEEEQHQQESQRYENQTFQT